VWAGSERSFVRSDLVRTRGAQPLQPLSYDLRLPEAAQADALRLLDAFATARSGPADPDHQAMAFSMGWRNWRVQAEPMTIPGSR